MGRASVAANDVLKEIDTGIRTGTSRAAKAVEDSGGYVPFTPSSIAESKRIKNAEWAKEQVPEGSGSLNRRQQKMFKSLDREMAEAGAVRERSKTDGTPLGYAMNRKLPHKAAGALATVFLVSNMNSSKGQQSNAELYGQAPPYSGGEQL